MAETAVKLVRLRKGFYRLDGVTHTSTRHRPWAPPCNGLVYAEWFGPYWDLDYGPNGKQVRRKFPGSWECFCEKCGDCDSNGWATLAECERAAPAFWMDAP